MLYTLHRATTHSMEHETGPPGLPFWRRVEAERIRRAWTAADLHRRSGVARSTIANLATQRRRPRPATVVALADVLGIPSAEAFALAGLDPEAAAVGEAATDDALDALLARLPEKRRQELEKWREEERERYEKQLADAREGYERGLSRIEKILRDELG
ncbi:helix-turn-helix domain-containing protein [Streptosporangium algeriense]|uniref:Helix-turn-helix domain-containing protein n=1 Tax=Streptosporangium algeriense TaxID=1682748 RepID=A0ABW3DPI7_9ACTN